MYIHIHGIAKSLNIKYKSSALYETSGDRSDIINMPGWHEYPTLLQKEFYEGSDVVMLALYKLNEVLFEAIVVYPHKTYNFESLIYEYRKNSFNRFIPS